MKDLPTTNYGKIPSKYIKEPFYSFGFKDGVKAERQRIKEEVEKKIKQLDGENTHICKSEEFGRKGEICLLCYTILLLKEVLALLEGEK